VLDEGEEGPCGEEVCLLSMGADLTQVYAGLLVHFNVVQV
jgi:hypothetical protein